MNPLSNTTPPVPDTPPQECDLCGGLGLLGYDVQPGHEKFGRAYPCPKCAEGKGYAQQQSRAAFGRSGLPDHYASLTFDSFWELPADLQAGKVIAAAAAGLWAMGGGKPFSLKQAAQAVAPERASSLSDVPANWLTLASEQLGVGKTGLAAAAVNYLITAHTPVVFFRLQELFTEIQSQYKTGDDKADKTLDRVQQADLLVLDECTIPSASPDKMRIFEEIVRYRAARGLATFLTTNHTQEAFEAQWGKRAASMVFQGHWIELTGKSLRRRNAPLKGW